MTSTQKRSGVRFVATCPPDANLALVNGRLLVIAPNHEPYYQNSDGTKEIIKPLPESK